MSLDGFFEEFAPGTEPEYIQMREKYRRKVAEIAAKVRAKVGDDEPVGSTPMRWQAAAIISRCSLMSSTSKIIDIVLRCTDHAQAFQADRGKRLRYFPAWQGEGDGGMAQSFVEQIAHRAMLEDVMATLAQEEHPSSS